MSLQNSYDSKVNKTFNINNVLLEIKKAALADPLLQETSEVLLVTENQDVMPFTHPLYDRENDVVYIDTRAYTSLDRSGELVVRNTVDKELSTIRAKLELVWSRSEKHDDVFNAFAYSNEIFARWLTDLISHRYGLNPFQQSRIMALAGLYTIGLFFNNIEGETTIGRYVQLISRSLPVSADVVLEVVDRMDEPFPRDIDEFVAGLHKLELGPRLKDFNTAGLYNMLGGSWFGNASSPELVALALEYPPCFASLVHMAINHNLYRRAGIGQRVDKFKRGNAHPNFERSIAMLIDKYTEE